MVLICDPLTQRVNNFICLNLFNILRDTFYIFKKDTIEKDFLLSTHALIKFCFFSSCYYFFFMVLRRNSEFLQTGADHLFHIIPVIFRHPLRPFHISFRPFLYTIFFIFSVLFGLYAAVQSSLDSEAVL